MSEGPTRSCFSVGGRELAVGRAEQTAADDAVLLFDGVFLQRSELSGVWDICLWVEASFGVTVRRAVERDSVTAHQTALVREKYERRYVPGQRLYLDLYRPQKTAHIVVDNADLANPSLHYQRLDRPSNEPTSQ